MANFREHVTVSAACGCAFGAGMWTVTPIDGVQAGVAGVLCGVAGMLPDLDSDRGTPIRELTALLGATVPFVAVRRLAEVGHSFDCIVGLGIVIYGIVRYGGAWCLRRFTVHRGMFHSLPAMAIAGTLAFLAYKSPNFGVRLLMGTGVMVGFASHLMLDEWYSVSWRGLAPRLKKSAGTAVKWASGDPTATLTCYALLAICLYVAAVDSDLIAINGAGVPQRIAAEEGPAHL